MIIDSGLRFFGPPCRSAFTCWTCAQIAADVLRGGYISTRRPLSVWFRTP